MSGAVAIASPTDTACNQAEGRLAPIGAAPPSRARALSGTPRVKRLTNASGTQSVTSPIRATAV